MISRSGGSVRGCLVASDARGLRDLTLWETNDGGAVNFHMVRQARPCRGVPAVLRITVAEIEESKAECREALERMERAVRDRDEARGERDEARAEVAALLVQLSEARDELDALRELADAAARRLALREAVAMPERVTAGEAFAAEGIPPGDMLGDREWLREYRAARALRGGGGT